MQKALLFWVGCLLVVVLQAQQYTTAVGLRLAAAPGLSLQQRLAGRYTVEGSLQSGLLSRQRSATLVLQRHYPLISKGMNLYLGGGPQWLSYARPGIEKNNENEKWNTLGLAAMAGLEMRLKKCLISLDYRPALHFSGPQLLHTEAALSVRYIIITAKAKKKKEKPTKKGWNPFRKESHEQGKG
jgi:hypothetical protein